MQNVLGVATGFLVLLTAPVMACNAGELSRGSLAFITSIVDERPAFSSEGGHREPWIVVAIAKETLIREHQRAYFEAVWMLPSAGVVDGLFVKLDCKEHTLGVQAVSHLNAMDNKLETSEIDPAGVGDAEMTPITETPWGLAAEAFACGV